MDGVDRAPTVLAVSLSSALPLLSIVCLSYMHRLGAKMAAMCGFTIMFSLSVGLVTNAKKVDLFAAAAA